MRASITASEMNIYEILPYSDHQVTSLSQTQIVCLPPIDAPGSTDHQGRRTHLPKVVVQIGSNLIYTIGFLRYEMAKLYNLPPEIMGVIATGSKFGIFYTLSSFSILTARQGVLE